MDPKTLRRECMRMTDRTMPINFRIAAARQIEAYILGQDDPAERAPVAPAPSVPSGQ